MKLTTTHLIELVKDIPQNVPFNYVNTKSRSIVELVDVSPSEGSITIKRTTKEDNVKVSKVDFKKLKAISDGLLENTPISIDDVLRNNDNVRSAIEAILVRTSEIYTYSVKNHKNMVWVPSHPHQVGVIVSLAADDYSLLREKTVKSFDDKLLNTAIQIMGKQLAATQELLNTQRNLLQKISEHYSSENAEKILRSLNEQLSTTAEILERQNSLKSLLTK